MLHTSISSKYHFATVYQLFEKKNTSIKQIHGQAIRTTLELGNFHCLK